jgi:hypothetical protein
MPPQQRKRLLEFVNEITDLGTHGYSPEIRLPAVAIPDLPTAFSRKMPPAGQT